MANSGKVVNLRRYKFAYEKRPDRNHHSDSRSSELYFGELSASNRKKAVEKIKKRIGNEQKNRGDGYSYVLLWVGDLFWTQEDGFLENHSV